jgi:hypothetical protein
MTEIDIKAEIDNVIDGLGPKLREFNSKVSYDVHLLKCALPPLRPRGDCVRKQGP